MIIIVFEGDECMGRGNTKQEILNASLDLFSVQGFEATSISRIADAVGIRKASLYSHFESKQAILDALVKEIMEQYDRNSIFAQAGKDVGIDNMPDDVDEIVKIIQSQIEYILHDEHISKARKILIIEQFQNENLAKMQTKQNYTDIMEYFTQLIKLYIIKGVLVDSDAEIMAAQLCLPISAWINLCDREPNREDEVRALISRHIKQFFKAYGS